MWKETRRRFARKIAAPNGELLLLRRVRVRDGTTERATKAKQALEDMSGRDEPTNLGLHLPAAQGRNEGPRDKRRKMAWLLVSIRKSAVKWEKLGTQKQ